MAMASAGGGGDGAGDPLSSGLKPIGHPARDSGATRWAPMRWDRSSTRCRRCVDVAERVERVERVGPIVTPDGARYRFGPREHGGALAGFRAGQILTVPWG